jgi:hypothetical protein
MEEKCEPMAFHFFRHNDPNTLKMKPLFSSLAAHLLDTLFPFRNVLLDVPDGNVDVEKFFRELLATPLHKLHLTEPVKPDRVLIILDGIDELKPDAASQLFNLLIPEVLQRIPWVRLFVTSRDSHAARSFCSSSSVSSLLYGQQPYELRVDDPRQQTRHRAIHSPHCHGLC